MTNWLLASLSFCATVPLMWWGMAANVPPHDHPRPLFYTFGWLAIGLALCSLICAVVTVYRRPEVWVFLGAVVAAILWYMIGGSHEAGMTALWTGPILGLLGLLYEVGTVLAGRSDGMVVGAWLLVALPAIMAVWTLVAMVLLSI